MPSSSADFQNQVNTHVGQVNTNPASPTYAPTGALFRCVQNADGTITILRSGGTSGVGGSAGGPQFPWVTVYPRVQYLYGDDKVLIGDGSAESASPAGGFISGLN